MSYKPRRQLRSEAKAFWMSLGSESNFEMVLFSRRAQRLWNAL